MFKGLFGRQTEFQKYMNKYAENIEKAANEFSSFINAFDSSKVQTWADRISDIEHSCDCITHDTMNWLESTFIVDYDREDIHELVGDLDDIVDFMDAAATRISLYNVEKMMPEVVRLAERLNKACFETAKAVREVSGPKLNRKVLDICRNIKGFEEEGDKIYHGVLASLFKDGRDPLDVIKFKEIVEEIERSLDKCNEVAMDVESIIFKYS